MMSVIAFGCQQIIESANFSRVLDLGIFGHASPQIQNVRWLRILERLYVKAIRRLDESSALAIKKIHLTMMKSGTLAIKLRN